MRREKALRFLIHLVGDLQQPFHVGDNHDRGVNNTEIRFLDHGSNMHRLGDSDPLTWNTRSRDVWVPELAGLDTDQNRATTLRGKVEVWATESLTAARGTYRVPATGQRIKPGERDSLNIEGSGGDFMCLAAGSSSRSSRIVRMARTSAASS